MCFSEFALADFIIHLNVYIKKKNTTSISHFEREMLRQTKMTCVRKLNLCILMDSSFWFDTMKLGWSIVRI